MTVKPVRSAERVLATLEALAEHQPMGVGALARVLDDDKSAVQRALVTLAQAGWIRPAPGDQARWELTARSLVVAEHAQRRSGLRQRVHGSLVSLADETGESLILAVRDAGRIVIVDVVESRQLVRTVPHVGMVIPPTTSAAGQAVLAAMDDASLVAFLGSGPDAQTQQSLREVAARGWSLNEGHGAEEGATSVGAAILDADGIPVGGIAISAVADRMPKPVQRRLGERVAAVAASLSASRTTAAPSVL
jgi:IclR family acetate operon transcriptional repressor